MDDQVFKKILGEALNPMKEDLKSLKEDVSELKEDVSELKEDVSELKEDVSELKEDVQTLKGSVLNIERTMTSYKDSYKINQHNIERLDTRVSAVEENLGIEPPDDLKVPHFSTE